MLFSCGFVVELKEEDRLCDEHGFVIGGIAAGGSCRGPQPSAYAVLRNATWATLSTLQMTFLR